MGRGSVAGVRSRAWGLALGFPVAFVQLGEPASGLDKEDMVGVEEGSGGMHQATHLSLRASRPR